MDKARQGYNRQRNGALKRGIAWELTFDQWLGWWGDDLDRRGVGHDKLSMQRLGDSGAYSLGNIRKGYPRDNAKTRALVALARNTEKAKRAKEDALNRAMFEPSAPAKDEHEPLDPLMDGVRLKSTSGYLRYNFAK